MESFKEISNKKNIDKNMLIDIFEMLLPNFSHLETNKNPRSKNVMIRFFDIVFCSLAILFISPLLITIIVILKFSGEEKFLPSKKSRLSKQ